MCLGMQVQMWTMCSCLPVLLAPCEQAFLPALLVCIMSQKPAAAKTQPKKEAASGGKRAAAVAPAGDKGYQDGALKSQCLGYFKKVANGLACKATAEEVSLAKEAVETYTELTDEDKTLFAKTFYDNKATKSFGFVRDFQQKRTAHKMVSENIHENYMTRTFQWPALMRDLPHWSKLSMRDHPHLN